MTMRTGAIAGVMAGLFCLAAAASATTVLPGDLAGMVRDSQSVVHGRVVDIRAGLTAGRRTIESVVTVAVLDTLKGEVRETVSLRLPGGRVGRYRRITVGAPQFAVGDEVVLFLKGRPPALPVPYGLSQGVYRVSRAAGQPLVTPPLADVPGPVLRGDPSRRPMPIEAFTQQVRLLAAAR